MSLLAYMKKSPEGFKPNFLNCTAMRKLIVLLLGALLLLPSCLDDPDIPDPGLEARLIFYNNLMEADKVLWEVDQVETTTAQSYGIPVEGVAGLEGYSHQARIKASLLDAGASLDSLDYSLDPFRYYMVSLLGTEQETLLICDSMDTSYPTLGLVKMRFLQASQSMGAVDIYVGGALPEHLKASGVEYGQLSDYVESTHEAFWNAVIVSPADVLPADSTLLSYSANQSFLPNRTYFGIINHSEADPESSFRMQVFNQPSY